MIIQEPGPGPEYKTLFIGGSWNGKVKTLQHLNTWKINGVKYKLRSYYEVVKEGVRIKKAVMVAESITDEEAIRLLREGGHMT